MKNTIFKTLSILFTITLLFSCSNEKLNKDDAPQELKDAIQKSLDLSTELTEIQIEAGKDSILNQSEIKLICDAFQILAIQNNFIDKTFEENKYYNAIMQDHRESLKKLSDKTKFLVDCDGYDELGIAIQKAALEVKDKTTCDDNEIPLEDDEVIIEENNEDNSNIDEITDNEVTE